MIASSASATAKIRAPSGISSPASRSGYPVPSQRSWCERTTSTPASCRKATPPSIWAPRSVCACITRHSAGLSGPGLTRMSSGTPILPMSWSRNPYSSAGSAASAGSTARGELERVALHPLRVLARARVLRLQRRRERGHRLHVGALEQAALCSFDLEEMSKIACVEHELILFRAPRRPAHRCSHGRAGEPFDDADQLERPERLQHERVGAGGAGDLLHVLHARQQHDPDLPRVGARLQLAAEREPVHARHAHVEHDHVGTVLRDARLGLPGAAGFVDIDMNVLESRAEQGAEPWIVIDE